MRISTIFDEFERIYLSFSGGKDSTVMLHLVMEEAQRRNRKVGVLFIDLEAQYQATIEHITATFERYEKWIDPYWIALPLHLRNAVSEFEPHWQCWDPDALDRWVRPLPKGAISNVNYFEFFRRGMEFEDFLTGFAKWFSNGNKTICFVGIRTVESLNRYRTIAGGHKTPYQNHSWTTWKGNEIWNAYPIYDWRTEDIWTFHGHTGLPYSKLYDLMHKAGLSIHQMRVCQPYGDDQRKGLWLFQIIEPETWGRIVARVNGANAGALYAREAGNIMGNRTIHLPPGHTWESYTRLLLASMPNPAREHFIFKIETFLRWHEERTYPEGIPDFADRKMEAAKTVPSWRRICKTLLKHDYWCRTLSFGAHKAHSYQQYLELMRFRQHQWGGSRFEN